jgi:hypothetical protein
MIFSNTMGAPVRDHPCSHRRNRRRRFPVIGLRSTWQLMRIPIARRFTFHWGRYGRVDYHVDRMQELPSLRLAAVPAAFCDRIVSYQRWSLQCRTLFGPFILLFKGLTFCADLDAASMVRHAPSLIDLDNERVIRYVY